MNSPRTSRMPTIAVRAPEGSFSSDRATGTEYGVEVPWRVRIAKAPERAPPSRPNSGQGDVAGGRQAPGGLVGGGRLLLGRQTVLNSPAGAASCWMVVSDGAKQRGIASGKAAPTTHRTSTRCWRTALTMMRRREVGHAPGRRVAVEGELSPEHLHLGADLLPPGRARRLLPGHGHAEDEQQRHQDGDQYRGVEPGGPQDEPALAEGRQRPLALVVGLEPAADQVAEHRNEREPAEDRRRPAPKPPARDTNDVRYPRHRAPPRGGT
jgi:hypothetical protein